MAVHRALPAAAFASLALALTLHVSSLLRAANAGRPGVIFPGATWEQRSPAGVGLDARKLDDLVSHVGGDGCIIKDGYLVKIWGDLSTDKWWASDSKPVFSTMLLLAVQEGRLPSVDAPQSRNQTKAIKPLATKRPKNAQKNEPLLSVV